MYGEHPSYEIISETSEYILIIDLDQGKSVTNGASHVIGNLDSQFNGGIGDRQVFYRDTLGSIDELKVKEGRFTGFAPCTESQQEELAKHIQ